MRDQYYLPTSTTTILNNYVGKCQNLALILDKYLPQYVIIETKNKGPWLQSLIKGVHIDTTLTRSAYNRWYTMMSAMNATLFNASLNWRMVIGLGGESVLETDITLHHLYGIPFIPASALKGLTRAYVTQEYKEYYVPEGKPEEQHRASKKIDDDHSEIKRIFGTQKKAGTVIFFDAMPHNGTANFVLDIMNPHYPDYYSGTKPPTNDQSPIPVTFLTVTDTTFTFALAPRHQGDPEHEADLKNAMKWLQEAIDKYGVGAKTSAGYGYFKKERATTEPILSPSATELAVQPQAPSRQAEQIRARLPQFRTGQEIRGAVIPLTDELRRKMPPDVRAVLRYESFPTTEVLMAVSEAEAQNWKPGETRICIFEREQEHNGLVIWDCKPRVKKDRNK